MIADSSHKLLSWLFFLPIRILSRSKTRMNTADKSIWSIRHNVQASDTSNT